MPLSAFEGASKFAVAAAHRLLADASNDDVILVAFALLKLHEKFLAYSDELELLSQLRGLTSAVRGPSNRFLDEASIIPRGHAANDEQTWVDEPIANESDPCFIASRRATSPHSKPPDLQRLEHRTTEENDDAEPLASEWEIAIQRAMDRLNINNDRAELALAKLIINTVNDYQAKTTALTDNHVRNALDLAIRLSSRKAE